jgi:Flp pilus assembly protein TadG
MKPHQLLSASLRKFSAERSANIAPIFALALLPLMASAGAAVDYSRHSNAEARLQSTSDTIALLISKELENGAPPERIEAQMNAMFAAALGSKDISEWSATYSYDPVNATVVVSANARLKTSLMAVAGFDTMAITTQSTAVNGSDHIEIALVLDNTGSMSSNGKLTQLKSAASAMIDELAQTQSGKFGKAWVSIVPFGVPVNVGVAHDKAAWLGPEKTTTKCSGSGSSRVCTTTTLTWNGCVGDRVSPHTTSNALPTGGSTLYPRYYGTCALSTITPLTNDLSAASARINAMVASGNTNIPVGLMWGWNMLTPSAPLSTAQTNTQANKVLRYMILLTDGDNTQNTIGSSVSMIDSLTETTCSEIKKTGVTVFSIRVIDGNASLLRKCASATNYYFDVSDPTTLKSVFQQILSNITRLRLAS